ncbi:MAG: hypothetical protein AB1305_05130 [Candidatus Hadarchaeota archaeon]
MHLKQSFKITATASDPSGVENVELWYRLSSDNAAWGSWALFGVDNDVSDNWSWSFTAPRGERIFH